MTILRGRVRSGRGDFGSWIEKLRAHYLEKTGLTLFSGTLNVELAEPYSLPQTRIRLEGPEYGGTVAVNLVPCRVLGRRAFIPRTDSNEQGTGHHPRSLVEIATDVKLRDLFTLCDGDEVEIEVDDA